jgi:hypothetical protein
LVLNAQTRAGSACSDPIFVNGRVQAVSQSAVVVSDVANPPGGFSPEDFEYFAVTFDTLVTPVIEEHFGSPSDVDGNGRTIVFFTKEVNALEPAEVGAITSGYFFARDLFPVLGSDLLRACATSNEAEILYLIVPDPSGEVGAPLGRQQAMQLGTIGMTHEQQHLVNAASRLFRAGGPLPFEEVWLNEGMSHIAEELAFYRASGLGPGLDLGSEHLTGHVLGSFNTFQAFNYQRLRQFYYEPRASSPFSNEGTRAARGASWSFLRYVADRSGLGDPTFFRALVNSRHTGLDNLGAAAGDIGIISSWLGDWSVASYVDNRVLNLPARFQDLSWNNVSLYESFGFDPPYILTSDLDSQGSYAGTLVAGGSTYIRFAVAARTVATLEVTSEGDTPPSTIWVTILRTR